MPLKAKAVETLEEVETLRLIRNEVRSFMTGSNAFISASEQLEWWERAPRTAFLYFVDGVAAGYGNLRREGEKTWLTGALLPDYRGKGYGRELFTHLLAARPDGTVPALEAWRWNEKALGLYESLGFRIVGHGEYTMLLEAQDTVPLFKVRMEPSASERVAAVLASGYVGEGPLVREYEEAIKRRWGLPERPLAVSSGTGALMLAYHLAGLGPGKRVCVTPMTCFATIAPLLQLGCEIVWGDVDPISGLLSAASVAEQFDQGPLAAVVGVDWGGRSCDYAALRKAAPKVPLIADAAHRFSAPTGADFTAYSTQAIKHLTTGDGGLLVVPRSLHERARKLRWFGLDREKNASFRCEQDIEEAGFKLHLNDIGAAIGLANLEGLHGDLTARAENALWYQTNLSNTQVRQPDAGGDWWLYTVLCDDREGLQRHLAACGIASSPVHHRCDTHSCVRQFRRPLPGVDAFSSRHLCLPVGPWVTEAVRKRVQAAVASWNL